MLRFHSLRIADLQPDADDAVAIALEVPGELRPEYAGLPGQHIVLRTELDGEQTRRTYSLVNSPGEWPLRIVARVHEKGRMSRHLAENVKVGDRIEVLPPNGSLTPRTGNAGPAGDSGARRYVAFASGCGITPVLSVAKAILAGHPANQFILFYGNSSTGRLMCREELLGLKDRYLNRLALHFVMSREPQEVELYNGRIDAARVRELARTVFEVGEVAEYFVCGPGDMIEQVTGALRELHVSGDRIHGEHFTAVTESRDVRPRDDEESGVGSWGAGPRADRPSTGGLRLERSRTDGESAGAVADIANVTVVMDGRRRTFTMRMNDDTVLDAAANSGLDLPFSCRAGVCSTCRTKVVSGEVEMAQNYALEEWELEQGYVLACQSRVKTRTLELDYDEK